MEDQQALTDAWRGYNSEQLEKREKVRIECVQKGLHWARSCVGNRSDGEVAQYMAEWIDEVQERANREQAERAHDVARRGVDAAESSEYVHAT